MKLIVVLSLSLPLVLCQFGDSDREGTNGNVFQPPNGNSGLNILDILDSFGLKLNFRIAKIIKSLGKISLTLDIDLSKGEGGEGVESGGEGGESGGEGEGREGEGREGEGGESGGEGEGREGEGREGEGGEGGDDSGSNSSGEDFMGPPAELCSGQVRKGSQSIGCVKQGCCKYSFQIASLCPGSSVCCLSSDMCGVIPVPFPPTFPTGPGTLPPPPGSQTTPSSTPPGSYKCYGNFMNLRPSGADPDTAKQDNLPYAGVRASNKLLDTDIDELNKRKQCYIQAGNKNCIHPAVIGAIASRESRGGKLLYSTNGYGNGGRAYGIMQCDGQASRLGDICKRYPWDSCEHINQLIKLILVPSIKQVQIDHPSWPRDVLFKGGVSAYNAGPGNVVTIAGMDKGTLNNDYSNDVIARAQRLVNAHGW